MHSRPSSPSMRIVCTSLAFPWAVSAPGITSASSPTCMRPPFRCPAAARPALRHGSSRFLSGISTPPTTTPSTSAAPRREAAQGGGAAGKPAYTEYATGGHPIWTPAYNTPILMDWVYAQKRGAAATNAPLLTITAPTMQATFSSTNVGTLNLAGTASDGHASVTLVTWTNFQSTTFNGVASGTTNWSVTNV